MQIPRRIVLLAPLMGLWERTDLWQELRTWKPFLCQSTVPRP